MKNNNLPQIQPTEKQGNEVFSFRKIELKFNLTDFWSWNQSNLIENRTRGILAEFIVKKALEIEDGTRIEWDSYDLITNQGIKIEVKSASYLQSWEQKKHSNIQFNIAKKLGVSDAHGNKEEYKRWSDYYIFCLLTEKNQAIINPMNLDQWIFYVVKTETINKKLKNQKTIGLKPLLKINPKICNFEELKETIK